MPICFGKGRALAAGLSKLTPKTSVSVVSILPEAIPAWTRLTVASFKPPVKARNIDGEKDVFLAAIIAELDGFPLIAEKSEIGMRCRRL